MGCLGWARRTTALPPYDPCEPATADSGHRQGVIAISRGESVSAVGILSWIHGAADTQRCRRAYIWWKADNL
eukprot:SAG25_NODE_13453_length_267_cov_0.607143_1_plen_71_part_01